MACGDCQESAADIRMREAISKRSCTDVKCCIIFVFFWVGMLFIAGFSIASGNVLRLIYGYDSYGNICGMDNPEIANISNSGMNMTERPRVFFMDVQQPLSSLKICVKECPDESLKNTSDLKMFAEETGSLLCDYNVTVDDYIGTRKGVDGLCPSLALESDVLLNHCVPKDITGLSSDTIEKLTSFLNSSRLISKVMVDLYLARWTILGMCGIALLLAFIILFLIRYFHHIGSVDYIVSFMYIVVNVCVIGGTIALWVTYVLQKNKLGAMDIQLEADQRNVTSFLVFSILATIFTVILLLVILVKMKRAKLIGQLLRLANKVFSAMPFLLIQPILTSLILILFFVYILVVFVCIAATGTPKLDPETDHVIYDPPEPVTYMWWYHAIGFIWTAEFILACHQFVIAASVVDWYFTRHKENHSSPILRSIWLLVTKHLGSMVFGAFIILPAKIPRAILLWTQMKLEWPKNCAILAFFNENAYISIGMCGDDFRKCAKKVHVRKSIDGLPVAAINRAAYFFILLGKLAVVALTAVFGLVIMGAMPQLHFYAVPMFVACIFTYMIADAFMSTYKIAVDTVLLCLLMDHKQNDGTDEKQYFLDWYHVCFAWNVIGCVSQEKQQTGLLGGFNKNSSKNLVTSSGKDTMKGFSFSEGSSGLTCYKQIDKPTPQQKRELNQVNGLLCLDWI